MLCFSKLRPAVHLPAWLQRGPQRHARSAACDPELCALQGCLMIAAHMLFNSTPCPGGVTAPLGPLLLAGAALQLLPLALTLRVPEASPAEALSMHTTLLVRLSCRVLLSLHRACTAARMDGSLPLKCAAGAQVYFSRLAEVAGARPVLAACDGLGPFVGELMAVMVDNSAPQHNCGCELLSLHRLALGTCHSAQDSRM